jgi:hypothetical protein
MVCALDESVASSILGLLSASRRSLLEPVTCVVVARCTGGLADSSMLSGLFDLSAMEKSLSNRFSPDMSAGPVIGPRAPKPCAPAPPGRH